MSGWVRYAAIPLLFSLALIACTPDAAPPTPTPTPIPPDANNVSVTVTGVDGTPLLHGVVIRLTDSNESDGQDHDSLTLSSCPPGQLIAAWAPNYQVGFAGCDGSNAYTISLQPLRNLQDQSGYSWASAYDNCQTCHNGRLSSTYNELSEWEVSGHATALKDGYFWSMYRGSDIYGAVGSPTERELVGNSLVRVPKVDEPNYKGPGFQLDFPGQAGNCAFCHAPAAVSASGSETSLTVSASGVQGEGITCEICHKVNKVILDDTGYPFVDKPGIRSLELLRSSFLTTGPFTNIALPEPSMNLPVLLCSSIFSSSDFCAACHYGKFGDTLIYNSYGEWKASSYAKNPDGEGYRTCQDCHMSYMQPGDPTPYDRRKACSETAPGFQDFNHNMMDFGRDEKLGRDIPRLIRGAATLDAEFERPDANSSLKVRVIVKNERAGHKFPTDSPLRHLILVLEARDQFGHSLLQVDGEKIPNWGGPNNASLGFSSVRGYAGLPGKIFANLLVEEDTNLWPSAAYWNETQAALVKDNQIASDTRLEPNGRDGSNYFFAVPDDGEVRFTISLIYRFGFYDLLQQKHWADRQDRGDIPVFVLECSGNANLKIQCKQTEP